MITVFTCEREFSAMLTCIYVAWASKLGHENIRLQIEPVETLSFLEQYVHVDADERKANSVISAVCTKISPYFYHELVYCFGAYETDTLDVIYRMLILGFAYGTGALGMYQFREVSRFIKIKKRYGNEAHSFIEFLRFNKIGDSVYAAHIEPKSYVLLTLAEYFSDRMPSENWIIIDDIHRKAVVHPIDQSYYFKNLTEEEFYRLKETEKQEDSFTSCWKVYFEKIAIKERANYLCQLNHFPKWKRKHVTEFN